MFALNTYRLRRRSLALTLAISSVGLGTAQQTSKTDGAGRPGETAVAWATAAAATEVGMVQAQGTNPVRYRTRKLDAKGDTTREVIETPQGSVARLVERNGMPLTHEEDAAEQDRLRTVLTEPQEFLKHHKHDEANREYSLQLIRLMPRAMRYAYAPGQPQLPDAASGQVVLDFEPDPNFQPPTMLADLLTGLAGRLWIDRDSKHLLRVEAKVLRPVNLGWGMVAKLYPGGTVEMDQRHVDRDVWVCTHLKQHLTVRALLVKTQTEDTDLKLSDIRSLSAPIPFEQAVRMLLAVRIPLS